MSCAACALSLSRAALPRMHVAVPPIGDVDPPRAQILHIVRRDRPGRKAFERRAGDHRRLRRKIVDAAAVFLAPPIDDRAVRTSLALEMQAVFLLQTALFRPPGFRRGDLDRNPMLRSLWHPRLPP